MKILRKPSYLGTTAQITELQTLASASGSYAERHRLARVTIGRMLIGHQVYLIPLGGKHHVIPTAEAVVLPEGVKPVARGTLTECDDLGVIAIEIAA